MDVDKLSSCIYSDIAQMFLYGATADVSAVFRHTWNNMRV